MVSIGTTTTTIVVVVAVMLMVEEKEEVAMEEGEESVANQKSRWSDQSGRTGLLKDGKQHEHSFQIFILFAFVIFCDHSENLSKIIILNRYEKQTDNETNHPK